MRDAAATDLSHSKRSVAGPGAASYSGYAFLPLEPTGTQLVRPVDRHPGLDPLKAVEHPLAIDEQVNPQEIDWNALAERLRQDGQILTIEEAAANQ